MEYAQADRAYPGQIMTANKLNQPKREDCASSMMERIDSQVSQLAELCVRLGVIVDRIDGSTPETQVGTSAGLAQGRPPHVVGSLSYINGRLGDKLGELQHSLSRIESALG